MPTLADLARYSAGVPDAAGTMLTGMVAQPVAGLWGLVRLALSKGDVNAAVDAINQAQRALTAAPQTELGSDIVEGVGKAFAPLESLKSTLGESVQDAGGGAGLATLAHVSPDILLSLMPFMRAGNIGEIVPGGSPRAQAGKIGDATKAGIDRMAAAAATDSAVTSPLKMNREEALMRALRKEKRAASGKDTGSWKNEPEALNPLPGVDLPPLEVGEPTVEGWLRRVNHLLTPEEQRIAAEWYRSGKMEAPFVDAAGAENAPYQMTGFLVGNQNTSPSGALQASLRAKEQAARGVPFELRRKGGTADMPLWDLWRGEDISAGVGQKINDFVDSAIGNPTRTFYGNVPSAGAPYTLDKLSGRGAGLIDDPLRNFIEKNYDPKAFERYYETPGRLKVDNPMGTWSETQYESGADFGRRLTDELNRRGYGEQLGLGKLDPRDVQALDWESIQRLMGREGQDVNAAIARNTNRVSAELSFGEGAPLAQKFDWASLTPAAQKSITRDGLDWVYDKANQILGTGRTARVHATGGWQNFDPSPAAVENLLSTPEGADAFAKVTGYLANQTEVWAARPASVGKGNAIALDILEEGGNTLTKGDTLRNLWTKINAIDPQLFQGYQPLVEGGRPGIRLIIRGEGAKVPLALRQKVESLQPQLADALKGEAGNYKAILGDLDLRVHGNNWKEMPDGQAYLGGLDELIGRERVQQLRDHHRREFETFLQGKFAAAKGGSGKAAKGGNKGRAQAEVGWDIRGPDDPYIDWLRARPAAGGVSLADIAKLK